MKLPSHEKYPPTEQKNNWIIIGSAIAMKEAIKQQQQQQNNAPKRNYKYIQKMSYEFSLALAGRAGCSLRVQI